MYGMSHGIPAGKRPCRVWTVNETPEGALIYPQGILNGEGTRSCELLSFS